MPAHTNVEKAERTIAKMPLDKPVDIKELAKAAGLGVRTMSRFLSREKKRGNVTSQLLTLSMSRQSLWRRVQ